MAQLRHAELEQAFRQQRLAALGKVYEIEEHGLVAAIVDTAEVDRGQCRIGRKPLAQLCSGLSLQADVAGDRCGDDGRLVAARRGAVEQRRLPDGGQIDSMALRQRRGLRQQWKAAALVR